MIKEVTGSLFNSTADVWIIPTNTEGAMGKGLALKFKRRFPRVFDAYRTKCRRERPGPTEPFSFRAGGRVFIMFHTKDRWSNPSRIEWIDHNLRWLRDSISDTGVSVAMPRIGSGAGQLNFYREVRHLIYQYLDDLDEVIYLYVRPKGT